MRTSRSAVALLLAALLLCCASPALAAGKKLRVYILAGQSNMEGHAKIGTIGYIGEDPATKTLYEKMVDGEGKPVVCDRVWVSNYTGFRDNNGVTTGPLTAGFGARQTPNVLGEKIGPEFTFGLTMQEAYDGPILLIKCAWGGKSLHTDFRPPSAGPFVFSASHIEAMQKRGKDIESEKAAKKEATGRYYMMMVEHVKKVLADPGKVVPGYDEAAGYEIAGFVWFQGWNDMADSDVYPDRYRPGGYDAYSALMKLFIDDTRAAFDAPQMPFVIGVMGVGGPIAADEPNQTQQHFRDAMAAPAAAMKNVVAVQTAPFWDTELGAIAAKRDQVRQMAHLLKTKNKNAPNADGSMNQAQQRAYLDQYEADLISEQERALWDRGASNAGYHYLGCGKTLAGIGQAFAQALIEMGG